MIEKLAGDWVAALSSSSNYGGIRHCEDTKLRAKLRRKLRLQFLDSSGQVPDLEELVCIYPAALIDVFPVHVG